MGVCERHVLVSIKGAMKKASKAYGVYLPELGSGRFSPDCVPWLSRTMTYIDVLGAPENTSFLLRSVRHGCCQANCCVLDWCSILLAQGL